MACGGLISYAIAEGCPCVSWFESVMDSTVVLRSCGVFVVLICCDGEAGLMMSCERRGWINVRGAFGFIGMRAYHAWNCDSRASHVPLCSVRWLCMYRELGECRDAELSQS